MTIPIRPGPFSFLAQFGQAGGEAFKAAHEEEDKLKKEAQNRLNMMLTLRSKGLIRPDAFHSPEAQQLYKRLGITPVSDQYNFEDIGNAVKTQYANAPSPENKVNIPNSILQGAGSALMPPAIIPAQGPDAVSDANRLAYGLPTRSAIGKEGVQAASLAAGGPGARATAGVESNEVAGAKEEGAIAQAGTQRAQFISGEADDFVAQALAGQDPRKYGGMGGGAAKAADDAYKLYAADAIANKRVPMEPDIAKRYFAGAVQKRIDYLKNQEIAAMRAFSYGQGQQVPILNYLDKQIDNANNNATRAEAAAEKYKKDTMMGLDPDQWVASGGSEQTAQQYQIMRRQADAARQQWSDALDQYKVTFRDHFGTQAAGQYPPEEARREWDADFAALKKKYPQSSDEAITDALGRPRP